MCVCGGGPATMQSETNVTRAAYVLVAKCLRLT